jgi:hypothetical protein
MTNRIRAAEIADRDNERLRFNISPMRNERQHAVANRYTAPDSGRPRLHLVLDKHWRDVDQIATQSGLEKSILWSNHLSRPRLLAQKPLQPQTRLCARQSSYDS